MWEVDVYPTPVEFVGGDVDGEVGSPGFSMDLEALLSAFDRVDGLRWSVHHHLDGPEVLIVGLFEGHEVYLRLLAEAPADEEIVEKLDVGDANATSRTLIDQPGRPRTGPRGDDLTDIASLRDKRSCRQESRPTEDTE